MGEGDTASRHLGTAAGPWQMPRKDTIPAPRTDTYGSRQRPGTTSGQEMASRPHQQVVSCVKELSEPGKLDGSRRADLRAGEFSAI